MRKGVAMGTLVGFILMIVVIIVVAMIFYRTAHNASETEVNKCDKCVESETDCNLDEVPMQGFGCPQGKYCCIKQNI